MRSIDEIRSDLQASKVLTMKLEHELHEARVAACGVNVGDKVTATRGQHRDKVGTVTSIKFVGVRPWVTARFLKADGTPRKDVSHLLGDWELSA